MIDHALPRTGDTRHPPLTAHGAGARTAGSWSQCGPQWRRTSKTSRGTRWPRCVATFAARPQAGRQTGVRTHHFKCVEPGHPPGGGPCTPSRRPSWRRWTGPRTACCSTDCTWRPSPPSSCYATAACGSTRARGQPTRCAPCSHSLLALGKEQHSKGAPSPRLAARRCTTMQIVTFAQSGYKSEQPLPPHRCPNHVLGRLLGQIHTCVPAARQKPLPTTRACLPACRAARDAAALTPGSRSAPVACPRAVCPPRPSWRTSTSRRTTGGATSPSSPPCSSSLCESRFRDGARAPRAHSPHVAARHGTLSSRPFIAGCREWPPSASWTQSTCARHAKASASARVPAPAAPSVLHLPRHCHKHLTPLRSRCLLSVRRRRRRVRDGAAGAAAAAGCCTRRSSTATGAAVAAPLVLFGVRGRSGAWCAQRALALSFLKECPRTRKSMHSSSKSDGP